MIDIGAKPIVERRASTIAFLRLQSDTLVAIKAGTVPKGDVFTFAEGAGLLAVKQTPATYPHCHPLPITKVSFDFAIEEDGVRGRCTVETSARTGVEMEALHGLSIAMLTIWDLVKAQEKDEQGQYPLTRLGDLRVVEKFKGV